MTRKILIEKNGDYYRVIGAVYNNEELIRAEEIVESRVLWDAKRVFFLLLPHWKHVETIKTYH
jgi:hypothetical protein